MINHFRNRLIIVSLIVLISVCNSDSSNSLDTKAINQTDTNALLGDTALVASVSVDKIDHLTRLFDPLRLRWRGSFHT